MSPFKNHFLPLNTYLIKAESFQSTRVFYILNFQHLIITNKQPIKHLSGSNKRNFQMILTHMQQSQEFRIPSKNKTQLKKNIIANTSLINTQLRLL